MNLFSRPSFGYDPAHDAQTAEERECEREAFEDEMDAALGLALPEERCFDCHMKGNLHRITCPQVDSLTAPSE